MAFCREKNQKLLFKVDSLLKFRKWFKYGLKAQKLQKLLPFTFALPFGQRFSIPLRAGDRWFRACGEKLAKLQLFINPANRKKRRNSSLLDSALDNYTGQPY